MVHHLTDQNPLNIAQVCLQKNAQDYPEKTALTFLQSDGSMQHYSYQQIEMMSLRFGGWLIERGFEKSARVFIKLPSGPEFVACFFGALSVGMVPIPMSSMLTSYEVEKFAGLVGPDVMVMEDNEASDIGGGDVVFIRSGELCHIFRTQKPADYLATHKDDPAFMVFTSGTRALPKVVVHGHRLILGRQPMFEGWTDIVITDRVLHAGALNWTYSLGIGLLDVFVASATGLFYTDRAKPEVWPDLIAKSGATIFAAVPSLYRRILNYGDVDKIAQSNLRHGLCAGEPLLETLLQRWKDKTGCPLYEALGMSEISTYISSSPSVAPKPGSPGMPQQGRNVCVLRHPVCSPVEKMPSGEEGVIAIREDDPGLFLGYLKDKEVEPPILTDGWFVTGDLAFCDEDGYFWFGGRGDEIMNPSGYRVSPIEVEDILSQSKYCSEIAVCELEIKEGLRLMVAFVVLAPQASEDVALADLMRFAEKLAAYKRPHQYKCIESLPRTANGKIKRADLAKIAI